MATRLILFLLVALGGAGLTLQAVWDARLQLATIEPATLPNIDLAARDGVSLRCDCWAGSTQHTFSMRSPTAQAAPRHMALCQLFFEAASAHVQQAQVQEYLAVLARSFH